MTAGHAVLVACCAAGGGLAGALVPRLVARLPEPELPDGEEKPPYTELARARALGVLAAVAGALACAVVAWRLGWHPALPVLLYAVLAGVPLTYIDARVHLLPSAIILPSYAIVVVLLVLAAVLSGDWGAFVRALGTAAALWLVFAIGVLVYPPAMGFGDVQLIGLMSLVAGWFGVAFVVLGLLLSLVVFSLTMVCLRLAGRVTRKTPAPLGPFLIVGYLGTTVFAPDLIRLLLRVWS